MPVAVAIMAKAPRLGEVKTRLCPPLSPAEAAALYRCFLLDKIEQVRALKEAHPAVAYTPPEGRAIFEELAPGFTLVLQRGADLGTRLANTLAQLLDNGHPAAVAVDSDTPTLPSAFLQQAVDLIMRPGPDVVLGPSDDGGYYLIGVRAVRRELFDGIPWSTPSVLAETLHRAAAAGLTTACLPAWFDVDTPDDLERLRASLADLGEATPAHTAGFLAKRASPCGAPTG
jgi:hypothetical protein